MKKPTTRYTLQSIGGQVDNLTGQVQKLTYTVDKLTQSVDILVETVGHILIEQTVIKDDIAVLKTDVSGLKTDNIGLKQMFIHLDQKTDGIINDHRAFRVEMREFQEETAENFALIRDDLNAVLPDHEVRIATLEGKSLESLGV